MQRGWAMPMDAQPADEFERRLREALEHGVDQRQRPSRSLELRLLLVQSFLSALFFRRVFHTVLLMPVLQEQQQVVHDGHKNRFYRNGKNVETSSGRYAKLGSMKPSQEVVMTFPISERTQDIVVDKKPYRVIIKGNTVVSIDPPGKVGPLYQRAHYRENHARWDKVQMFAPDKELLW